MTENCLEIEEVLKFKSLEACKGKKTTFGWLGQPYKSLKFKFAVSGKKNVCLFGVMTKISVLSNRKVPLTDVPKSVGAMPWQAPPAPTGLETEELAVCS